jgi:hypothetical protein
MKASGRWMCRRAVVLALGMVLTSQGALAQDAAAPASGSSSPPMLRAFIGPLATWRQYCARPGVTTCAEFDAIPEELRKGDAVDFTSLVPYMGLSAEVEVFPLVGQPSLLRGAGVLLGLQRGFPRPVVQVSSPSGDSRRIEVPASDTSWEALATWRYFFNLGQGGTPPVWGHGGLAVGARSRAFAVREPEDSPLPQTHRFYPVLSVEASVPLMRLVRLEGSGEVFLQPAPGQALGGGDAVLGRELSDYGTAAASLGWAAELGVAGDVWGPLGYSVRFRLERYQDRFTGAGTRSGWALGGVAVDTYSGLQAGVTAAW